MSTKDKSVSVHHFVGGVSVEHKYTNMEPAEVVAFERALGALQETTGGADESQLTVTPFEGLRSFVAARAERKGADEDRRASVVSEVLDVLRLRVAYYDPGAGRVMRPVGTMSGALSLEALRALSWDIVNTVLPRG
jgi:hypothetical protein